MDINKLTLGEIAIIEEHAGISIDQAEEAPKGKLMAAMVYVIKRRTDPKFKFSDAMALTSDEANAILGFESDPKS